MGTSDEHSPLEFRVPEGISRERADRVLARFFPEFSRSQIQRAFGENGILREEIPLDSKSKVSEGEMLCIQWIPVAQQILRPRNLPLEILFEDEHLVGINKPVGEVVHPGSGTHETLVEALLTHTAGHLATAAGELRPGVVHRLDRDTSGILLFAKSNAAYFALVEAFAARKIYKIYHALVVGIPSLESGSIRLPIGRDAFHRTRMAVSNRGKAAHTDWYLERRFEHFLVSLLRLRLHSGRTHQIRVHLAAQGWSILGDATYGFRPFLFPDLSIPRVMLHASSMVLQHPISGNELKLEAPLPPDMESFLRLLEMGKPPHLP